jgi:hypothetical protein
MDVDVEFLQHEILFVVFHFILFGNSPIYRETLGVVC